MQSLDTHARPLGSLRLSVTDRCNLRCAYCMPEEEYRWLPRSDILDFEELSRLAQAFADVGVRRVRLTGGEPLLRRDLSELVRLLAAIPELEDLALTTNGLLLAEQAAELAAAGLQRVSVSLDTLVPATFRTLARRDGLERVLEGLEAARAAGLHPLKIDTVLLRGTNEHEIVPLLERARTLGAELRFIEYMDVGGATRWTREQVVTQREILRTVAEAYGAPVPIAGDPRAPAERFLLPDGLVFGVIASVTRPFCGTCDRSRVTADGRWFLCLYAREGHDLRALVRSGAPREQIAKHLADVWAGRTDRGAEERLAEHARASLAPREALERDPHLEMHVRGG